MMNLLNIEENFARHRFLISLHKLFLPRKAFFLARSIIEVKQMKIVW